MYIGTDRQQITNGDNETVKNYYRRLKEALSHIGLRSIATALTVFIITAGIAGYVGIRYYEAEKEVLLLQGELNARESAIEYNSCLLTRVNIVTLVGRAVDEMLSRNTGGDQIEAYLTQQTEYIISTLDPHTTGLYGWIAGEYLDGSGWVPDADYVATERPWYLQTLQSEDEITFVEPYLDVQTNTVMMTVSELLSDGKSVLAMDVSLDPIQNIVEQVSSETEGSQALVIDTNGIVVAHSDKTMLGRNFLEMPDSAGSRIAKKILIEKQMNFDIDTPEGSYSVYADQLMGGWYSISLINSDNWYRPLRRTMNTFAVILILIMAFLVVVFLHLNEKNQALQKLHTIIDQEEKRGEELQLLSETDRMTGLFDRVTGKRKVDDLLASSSNGMFLELDIDQFKHINDTFGHQTGDRVILALTDALRSTFRSNDILMRLGGDEFGVFAVGIVDPEMGAAIVSRLFTLLDRLELPELNGGTFHVSIGAALSGGTNANTFNSLYALADSALYDSKKTPGNSLTFNS